MYWEKLSTIFGEEPTLRDIIHKDGRDAYLGMFSIHKNSRIWQDKNKQIQLRNPEAGRSHTDISQKSGFGNGFKDIAAQRERLGQAIRSASVR